MCCLSKRALSRRSYLAVSGHQPLTAERGIGRIRPRCAAKNALV